MNRTDNYLATVYLDESAAAIKINSWRQAVRKCNKLMKKKGENIRCFMRVRGRLGKDSPYAHFYAKGGINYRPSSQDIKFEHSERVVLYIGHRTKY